MTEEHKHCRICSKPIPMDKRPRYCSENCEDHYFLLWLACIGAILGISGYILAWIAIGG